MNSLLFVFKYILTPVCFFILLEGFTWWLHKEVMHGWGWVLHKSHHENIHQRFELNDLYGVFFSVIAFILLYFGPQANVPWWLMAFGYALTAYGFCYFFVHDILIHRRFGNQIYRRVKHPYIRRLMRAHAIHHQKQTKKNCEAFGFLYAPKKYTWPTQDKAQK
jgi:beta-carotene 3-hydroxylase